MAQFRVEIVLDQSSGKYLAELHDPDNPSMLLVRTEALYPTQAAAVLGVVQLFKNAILQFPRDAKVKRIGAKKKKKAKRKARSAKRPSAGRRSRPKKSPRRASRRG